jgi:hypothetical protein
VILSLVRTLLLLALLVACKGKPRHQATPENTQVPLAGSGSAVKAAPDLVLPVGNGKPPKKTTAAVDATVIDQLAKMTFPGFKQEIVQHTPTLLEVRHTTDDRPRVAATITVQPCFDCLPMELAKWQERSDALQLFLVPELKALPDKKFLVAGTNLRGTPMMFTYQLAKKGDLYTHAYVLYYNDGVNQIRVVAEYKDDVKLIDKVPAVDLENIAKSFADVYLQAW